MEGSGGKSKAKDLSKVTNPYLSNAVHQCFISLVKHRNEDFLELPDREIRKGKRRTQASIIVGRRLLYPIFTIMKNQKPHGKDCHMEERGRWAVSSAD
ncbi:MAG: hypothetical protein QXQ46_04650 [Thermoplasmatales archaeon]